MIKKSKQPHPMPRLIFTDKDHAGRVYELALEKTTVGRGDENTLVIADSSLSAQHCEIHVNGPEVIVRDLASRNGTYVNGLKLMNHQAQLKSGQLVRFGTVEARLELDGLAEDDSSSDLTAVIAHGRILRDQRREAARPKPADPSMRLESSDPKADADRTATALTTMPAREAPAPAPPAPAAKAPETGAKTAALLITAVTVLGLIALLWWLWGRK
jgi:pSer/pThr/pTyr-binding forkhead associated (FHA) protein